MGRMRQHEDYNEYQTRDRRNYEVRDSEYQNRQFNRSKTNPGRREFGNREERFGRYGKSNTRRRNKQKYIRDNREKHRNKHMHANRDQNRYEPEYEQQVNLTLQIERRDEYRNNQINERRSQRRSERTYTGTNELETQLKAYQR